MVHPYIDFNDVQSAWDDQYNSSPLSAPLRHCHQSSPPDTCMANEEEHPDIPLQTMSTALSPVPTAELNEHEGGKTVSHVAGLRNGDIPGNDGM